MDSTLKTKTLQSLNNAMKNEDIKLTHKYQRPEGQWNRAQKSDLIDSLLRKYPINPTYAIKEDKTLSIIDGVQRLSTVRDFLNDGFSLSKKLIPVTIRDIQYDIAGKKFSKLDEVVQNEILASELHVYILTDCTEYDVKEIFRRQNAGKPLTTKLKRVIYGSDAFNGAIQNLMANPFIQTFTTKTQRKNGVARDLVIESLMLISSTPEHEYLSFKSDDITSFVVNAGDASLSEAPALNEALETLYIILTDTDKNSDDADKKTAEKNRLKLPLTSIPQIIYAAYRVNKSNADTNKLKNTIESFVNDYDNNNEYDSFLGKNTDGYNNVKGRFELWQKQIEKICK